MPRKKGLAAGCRPLAFRAGLTSRLSIATLEIAKTRAIVNLRVDIFLYNTPI